MFANTRKFDLRLYGSLSFYSILKNWRLTLKNLSEFGLKKHRAVKFQKLMTSRVCVYIYIYIYIYIYTYIYIYIYIYICIYHISISIYILYIYYIYIYLYIYILWFKYITKFKATKLQNVYVLEEKLKHFFFYKHFDVFKKFPIVYKDQIFYEIYTHSNN